jgi:hypothetical protein
MPKKTANANCLAGMKCPECGALEPFDITAQVRVERPEPARPPDKVKTQPTPKEAPPARVPNEAWRIVADLIGELRSTFNMAIKQAMETDDMSGEQKSLLIAMFEARPYVSRLAEKAASL